MTPFAAVQPKLTLCNIK